MTHTNPHTCSDCGKGITIASIKSAVASYYGVRLADMDLAYGCRADRGHARQVAMALSRKLTRQSLNMIRRRFGLRHHTSVWRAERVIEARRHTDHDLDHDLRVLMLDIMAPGAEARP